MLTTTNKNDTITPIVGIADFLCQNGSQVCVEEQTVFPTIRRKRAFLLEGKMETKVCYKCKETKPISKFRQYKSGKNKGYFGSYCKKCETEYGKSNTSPWVLTYCRIKTRCLYDVNHGYYKRKISCDITGKEVKLLWFRDKAWLLNKPSIDRIDSTKGYSYDNCRFIELSVNLRRRWLENSCKEDRKPCKQLTSNGKLIKIYKSQAEAGRQTGINQGNISGCILGKGKTAGGYKWQDVTIP